MCMPKFSKIIPKCAKNTVINQYLVSFGLAALGTLGLASQALASTAVVDVAPASFIKGATSTLTLSLGNETTSPVTFTAGSAFNLPAGLTFAATPAPATTCGVTLSASGSALTISGTGTIPPKSGTVNGACTITATITSSAIGSYNVALPAAFFAASDGNQPGAALVKSVDVSDYLPVSIALRTTNGTNTTSFSQAVLNGLYSDNPADFDPTVARRMRFVLTNPNPVPITGVNLPIPDLQPIHVIPESLVSGSLKTSSGSLSTGVTAGCGGAITVADYTVNYAAHTFTPASLPTPATLSGATIPANGSCEFSFLARSDATGTGPNTQTATLAFGGNMLSSNEGVTNAPATITQNYYYSNFVQALATDAGGFRGDTGTAQLIFNNGGQTAAQDPGSTVYWTVDPGIEPTAGSFTATLAACPSVSWNSGTRRFVATAAIPAATNCIYNITFTATYDGTTPGSDPANTYKDAKICAVGGNVTLPSGYIWSKATPGVACGTYRAVAATALENAGAVQVDATVINPLTGNNAFSKNAQTVALLQLKLTAPNGVSNFSLASSGNGNDKGNLVNYDQSLSYVPVAATTCPGASVTAVPNSLVINVTNVNLGAGESCLVTVPVLHLTTGAAPNFLVNACDAVGTVGSVPKCSAVDQTFALTDSGAGRLFSFTHELVPAISSLTLPDTSTVYRLTVNKATGVQPFESLGPLTINFARFAGVDMNLQATSVISNTCNATVSTALPAGSVTLNNISTPDADAQGSHGYNKSAGFDANAFKASSCTIAFRLTPSPAVSGTETVTGITTGAFGIAISTATATPVNRTIMNDGPARVSYTLISGNPSPVTITKGFNPASMAAGEVSTLTVRVNNQGTNSVDLTGVSLVDNYPAGELVNASPLTTTLVRTVGTGICSGDLQATAGGSSLTLVNGRIGAATECAYTVKVVALNPSGTNNVIPAANFISTPTVGAGADASSPITLGASLGVVLQLTPATLNYDPVTSNNNVVVLDLNVMNSFATPATALNLTGALATGLVFANTTVTPDAANGPGCGTVGVTAGGTAFAMTGAAIDGNASCKFKLNVQVNTAPTTASQDYTATVLAGGITATVASEAKSNGSAAVGTLTVAQPATIRITKTVTGQTAGAPAATSAYPVTITCANTNTAQLVLGVSQNTALDQQVQAGDTCTVTEGATLPTPGGGYQWTAPAITPNNGTVTAAAAGSINNVNIENPLAFNTARTLSGSVVFNPAVGTPPALKLDCTPAATSTGANAWTAPQGASCTLGVVTPITPPAGYSVGSPITYGGTGVSVAGAFTVPAANVTNLLATIPIAANTSVAITASMAFSPTGTTGGTLPTLSLACSPAVTSGAYPTWNAPVGAACQFSTSGGTAPGGYTLGTVSYSGLTTTSAFNAAAGTVNVTVGLNVNTAITLQGLPTPVTFDPNIPGGTLPSLTLSCVPSATPAGANAWTAPQGAHCQLAVTGGAAPAGRALGDVTYGGDNVDPTTGQFTVGAPVSNLSAKVMLKTTASTPIPALDPKMLLALALLIASAGWMLRYRRG